MKYTYKLLGELSIGEFNHQLTKMVTDGWVPKGKVIVQPNATGYFLMMKKPTTQDI